VEVEALGLSSLEAEVFREAVKTGTLVVELDVPASSNLPACWWRWCQSAGAEYRVRVRTWQEVEATLRMEITVSNCTHPADRRSWVRVPFRSGGGFHVAELCEVCGANVRGAGVWVARGECPCDPASLPERPGTVASAPEQGILFKLT
jgi:hypothetical protein